MSPEHLNNQSVFSDNAEDVLEKQLRWLYGNVIYTHKTHGKNADNLQCFLKHLKFWQVVLSAITVSGFASILFELNQIGLIIGGVVSVVLLCINLYMNGTSIAEAAQRHRNTAAEIWKIREKLYSLIIDLRIGSKSIETTQKSRDLISDELYSIYKNAPDTNAKSYRMARKAIKKEEEASFTKLELDTILPSPDNNVQS